MTKALFRKQLMEVFSWLYKDRKTGKIRSTAGIVGYVVLYLFLFVMMGSLFFMMASGLCQPMLDFGLGWLYWCLMGLLSLFFGVFGSVFSTYTSLYQSKDNDLLLSMPIPVSRILAARLFGVYAVGLMYELIVTVPAQIVWFMTAPFSWAGAVCVLLIPLVLSLLILSLSAILGWVVALIAGRLKHKNMAIVIVSIAFIAGYYYIYGRASELLQLILTNAQAMGDAMKSALYPLYHMGLAAEGNLLSMLIFTGIIGALFAIVCLVLSRSFLKLTTTHRGVARAAYRKQAAKVASVSTALLKKELSRFTGSANYMLNCGLGILFMPIAAVMLVWKADEVQSVLAMPMLGEYLPLLAAGAICLFAAFNDIAAPSVSLEGRNLWLVQSLPVSGRQVLAAKMKLQILLTVIPAIPLIVAVEWLLHLELLSAILLPIVVVLFILFMAALGLTINLKMPLLNWTSEIVPIKQSMSVTLALFGGWIIIAACAGLYFLLRSVFSPAMFLMLVSVLLLAGFCLLLRWLQTRGARIFSTL